MKQLTDILTSSPFSKISCSADVSKPNAQSITTGVIISDCLLELCSTKQQ